MRNEQQHAVQLALGFLVSDFAVEATLWPDLRASLIRQQGHALDGIRVQTILGELEPRTAAEWLDAGRLSLAELKYQRTLVGNSAVDLIRKRIR